MRAAYGPEKARKIMIDGTPHILTGEGNGLFKAYDSATGSVLWQFQAGAGVNAPPSSYTAGGKQYVVVGAGGNAQLNYKRGNSIIAFTLAD